MNSIKPALDTADAVHLWVTDTTDISDQGVEERYVQALGQAELDSYKALANAEHRREYLISQAFLRDVLSHYLEQAADSLEFVRNASGKPSLQLTNQEAAPLHFNLSHSSRSVACAVTYAGHVGVDVETSHPDSGLLAMAEHYFAGDEVDCLQKLDGERQQMMFARIWTLKEAYIKARGEGHSKSLDSFSFDCKEPGSIRLVEDAVARQDWRFWSLQPIADQTVSVAVESAEARLRLFSTVPFGAVTELPLTSLGQVA
ncbi:4'-phosphopantetheinyl transferase superfamily protein [Halieaceae bacterium IMCC14734]|uniref:4'-phosphopantetheinyl transferase superfamily protein n=1 Tax=Candidatus Litorirhabdus singularis TaxID=2518993 RepID=A0ABT3TJ21_9GAMM|nr:4'-phosphopantetheinyl transferase superfamily protein [Candidatus Litorirhabdus singularis]MCX2981362.1 4'-phosphopantetheinyl transferase superfamily protein [Candidatus Litorirhabdus singularis]